MTVTPNERIRQLLDQLDPYKSGAATMAQAVEHIREELAKIEDPGTVGADKAAEILGEIRGLRADLAEKPKARKTEA